MTHRVNRLRTEIIRSLSRCRKTHSIKFIILSGKKNLPTIRYRMFHDVGKGMHDRSVVNTMLSRGKQKTLLLIPTQAMMLALSTGVQYSAGSPNQSN